MLKSLYSYLFWFLICLTDVRDEHTVRPEEITMQEEVPIPRQIQVPTVEDVSSLIYFNINLKICKFFILIFWFYLWILFE